MRIWSLLFAAIAVLATLIIVGSADAGSTVPRPDARVLRAVASVAGHWVRVRCDLEESSGADGVSRQDSNLVRVRPWVCREANWFTVHQAAPYSRAARRQASALEVLVHESVHQRGAPYSLTIEQRVAYAACRRSAGPFGGELGRCVDPAPDLEARTECLALQLLDGFARDLGASDAVAIGAAHAYLRVYAKRPVQGDFGVGWLYRYYRDDSRCRDGGEWDARPDQGGWPAPERALAFSVPF